RCSRCRSHPRTPTRTSATPPARSGECMRASRAEERHDRFAPARALLDPREMACGLDHGEPRAADPVEELAFAGARRLELAVHDEGLRLDLRQVRPQVELSCAGVERLQRA